MGRPLLPLAPLAVEEDSFAAVAVTSSELRGDIGEDDIDGEALEVDLDPPSPSSSVPDPDLDLSSLLSLGEHEEDEDEAAACASLAAANLAVGNEKQDIY